mgnify:CR=1 FL=1
MKINITNESGDWKEKLYTKDKVTYEIKSQEIIDFFNKLSESYNNDENMEDMYECLYNLLNYGYLYTDSDYCSNYDDVYEDFDEDDDDDYDYEDEDDYDCAESSEGIKLIDSEIEYYVDGEQVTKDEYDDAWDERIGYLGSSNWEEEGLCITNAETEEILFFGKIS